MVTPLSVQGHTDRTHHFFIFDIRAAQDWAPERPNVKN